MKIFAIALISSFVAIPAFALDAPKQITGFDGIKFGQTPDQAKVSLQKRKYVEKKSSGEVNFGVSVPGRSYHTYWANREFGTDKVRSECNVKYSNGKVFLIEVLFEDNAFMEINQMHSLFTKRVDYFTKLLGQPTSKTNDKVIWSTKTGTAVLLFKRPQDNIALPLIKLTITKA